MDNKQALNNTTTIDNPNNHNLKFERSLEMEQNYSGGVSEDEEDDNVSDDSDDNA